MEQKLGLFLLTVLVGIFFSTYVLSIKNDNPLDISENKSEILINDLTGEFMSFPNCKCIVTSPRGHKSKTSFHKELSIIKFNEIDYKINFMGKLDHYNEMRKYNTPEYSEFIFTSRTSSNVFVLTEYSDKFEVKLKTTLDDKFSVDCSFKK